MVTTSRQRSDQGFTMIEVAVTAVLTGILLSLAVGPYTAYKKAQQQRASTREVVGALRETQSRAVSEECPYRVVFSPSNSNSSSARSFIVQKEEVSGQCSSGGTWVTKDTQTLNGTTTWVSSASFDNLSPDEDASPSSVYFYARGTGTPGSLVLSRTGSTKTYTVTVEGLTGRVSSDVNG